MKAIEVRDVHFTYDDGTEALAGIDFQVEEGEFVAVLGSNGSGKTTLIKLLVGLLKAKAGQDQDRRAGDRRAFGGRALPAGRPRLPEPERPALRRDRRGGLSPSAPGT